MVLTGIREMEMREMPDPEIKKPTDVLIRMGAVGVCGSDVHYYETGRIGSQIVQYPYAVGHEGAGTVVETGPAVTTVKPGDRIAIEPAIACGTCDQCKVGRSNTCRHLVFLGCPGQIPGCLSEFIVMPESCCIPIKDETTLPQATISEPLAIGVYAVKQSVPMAGASVGILGMGPIGMSVMMPARAAGAKQIFVTDKVEPRLALARRMGADYAGNPDEQDIVGEMLELEPASLDVVFECCGQQDALDQAIELLKPGGKLMLIGIPEVDRVSFVIDKMRRKELCIQNVRRQEGCVQAAIDLIDNREVDIDPLITHSFPFSRTKEAFDMVAGLKDGVMKAMITFE